MKKKSIGNASREEWRVTRPTPASLTCSLSRAALSPRTDARVGGIGQRRVRGEIRRRRERQQE